jgi:hypothetical protein
MFTIKYTNSRTGLLVPSINGNYLCSQVDPIREACRWLAIQSLQRHDMVVVMGLGAGYHVLELAKAFPLKQIIAFELFDELIIQFARFGGQPPNLSVTHFDSPESLLKEKLFEDMAINRIKVVSFLPACQPALPAYQKMVQVVAGRTPDAFLRVSEIRGLPKARLEQVKVDHMFSVKDICVHTPNSQVWLLLRELVR